MNISLGLFILITLYEPLYIDSNGVGFGYDPIGYFGLLIDSGFKLFFIIL